MRPAYRYAAVFGGLVLVGLVVTALWWVRPEPPRRATPAVPQLEVAKPAEAPPPGPPSAETVIDMLDRVEAAEIQRFGEAEAARRRRTREQLIDDRSR